MESVTSMMSVSASDGVRNLDDDEGDQLDFAEHSAETMAQMAEITSKFSELLKDDHEDVDDEVEGWSKKKEKAKIEFMEDSKSEAKSKAEKRQFGDDRTGQWLHFYSHFLLCALNFI